MRDSVDVATVLPLPLPLPLPAGWTTPATMTVIVPTRNEADNVAELVRRLERALRHTAAEILFVDDSDDETPNAVLAVSARSTLHVRLLHRVPGDRHGGLGGAVLMGLHAASGSWAVVMDGDLQHPPELVPELVAHGTDVHADLVAASRYSPGGEQTGLSGPIRVAVSGLATTVTKIAFPRQLRGVSDPLTGFFAVRVASLDLAALRPQGFKILLEILVRSRRLNAAELPFHFAVRHAGDSKASLAEGARFCALVARLRVAAPAWTPLGMARARRAVAFGLVGASGFLVNTLLLWLLVAAFDLHYVAAAVLGTQGASAWNFLWTERWVFGGPKPLTVRRRFARFTFLNSASMFVSIPLMMSFVSVLGLNYLLANVVTIGLMFVARFVLSERLVYRSRGFVELLRERGAGRDGDRSDAAGAAYSLRGDDASRVG